MVVKGPGPEKAVADGNPSTQPDPAHPFTPAAIQRSSDHRYTFQGRTYPGVTGILGILDKSGPLMYWAAKETAKAALRLYEEIPKLRATVGDGGVIRALSDSSGFQRDEAAKLGTEVHSLADLVVQGKPTPPMPEATRKRVLKYAEWWKASGWKLRLSEALVVQPDFGYGGTFDLLAYDRDGRTVLADIKTGKGVYREVALQLAAYGMADYVAPLGSPVAYPMPEPDRYCVLHVLEDEVREVEFVIGDLERQAFLACMTLSEWADTMKGKRL